MAGPAVTSAFGNRPSSLTSPTPDLMVPPVNPADIGNVGRIVSGQNSVGMPVIPPATQDAEADPFASLDADLAAFDAGTFQDQAAPTVADGQDDLSTMDFNPEAMAAEDGAMSTQPMPTGWASAKEQIMEAGTRIRNSFAVTPKESVGVLKSSGMFDDVRYSGDTVQVKRRGRKGWEDFDRDKLELLSDALDFSRDAMEGVVENSVRVAGAVGGTFAAPGVGTLAGAAGAGAVGAITAKNAGDLVAQTFMGVERDTERSLIGENALAASFGAGFSMIGSALARRAASRLAIRGEATKTIEHATMRAKDAIADIAEINRSGIQLGPNGNFRLDPQQLVGAGQIPELDATAKELSTEQSFRNFRKQVGDSIQGAYDSVAKTLGAAAGKGANLGDEFQLTAQDVTKAESSIIGMYRGMARESAGTTKFPAQRAAKLANEMMTRYGGSIKPITNTATGEADFQLVMPTIKNILREHPTFTPEQAGSFRHEVVSTVRRLAKGQGTMRLDDTEVLYNGLSRKINGSINTANGRGYAIALVDLKNAVRDDWTDMIGSAVGDTAEYGAAKAKYRAFTQATDELGKVIDMNNISKNELISKLFEGKGSYKFAQSAKTLIQETNPKLWDNLSAEYFTKLRNEATNPENGVVNWAGMTKKWTNLDPRLQEDLLNTTGIKPAAMDAIFRLGNRFSDTSLTALAKEPEARVIKKLLKSAFVLVGGGATVKGATIGNLFDGMGKDQAVAKWLKDGGMEEVLKELPGLKAESKHGFRQWISNWTPRGTRQATQTMARRRSEEALSDNGVPQPEAPVTEEP